MEITNLKLVYINKSAMGIPLIEDLPKIIIYVKR